MTSTSPSESMLNNAVSPADFNSFLPWACQQLSVELTPILIKNHQAEFISSERSKGKGRNKGTHADQTNTAKLLSASVEISDSSKRISVLKNDKVVLINTIYDYNDNLVQLKIQKNVKISREVMKIIALAIPFHKHLYSIIIERGLDQAVLYEIAKFLPASNITEICIDGTFVAQANYDILLDKPILKHLSLSKCKIEDTVVQKLAAKLTFPSEASKTLSILNLASNRITDIGVKYLADALRANRKLSYLNISDNLITDVGANYVLGCLKEFLLTTEEIMDSRKRQIAYLKQRNELIAKTLESLRAGEDDDKKESKKRSIKLTPKKRIEGMASFKNTYDVLVEKAEATADNILVLYSDPFSPDETTVIGDEVHCLGNNALCYLNIAYNHLSYISVKKLLHVLHAQKHLQRKPKGLIQVKIEGNYLPEFCKEYAEIEEILDVSVVRPTSIKRRISTKDSNNLPSK